MIPTISNPELNLGLRNIHSVLPLRLPLLIIVLFIRHSKSLKFGIHCRNEFSCRVRHSGCNDIRILLRLTSKILLRRYDLGKRKKLEHCIFRLTM